VAGFYKDSAPADVCWLQMAHMFPARGTIILCPDLSYLTGSRCYSNPYMMCKAICATVARSTRIAGFINA
jgi:hypothetical protein